MNSRAVLSVSALLAIAMSACSQSAQPSPAISAQRVLPQPCALSLHKLVDNCGNPDPQPPTQNDTVLRLHGTPTLIPWDDSGLSSQAVSLRTQSLPPSASDTQDFVHQLFAMGRWSPAAATPVPAVGTNPRTVDGCTLSDVDAVYNPDVSAVDQSGTADIYPTAIVQGQDVMLGGPNPRPIHVPADQRAPIALVDRFNNVMTTPVSTSSDYATALHAMMLTANQQEQFQNSDISFDVRTASSLDEASQVFHTDFKAFGANITGDLTTSQSAHSNTVYAVFQQVLYDVSSDLKGKYPVNGLFNSKFQVPDLYTLGKNGDIDSTNLPTYISNVRYGRGFVVAVTGNDSATHLKAIVKAAFTGGSASLTASDQQTFKSSDFKVHAYGGAPAPQIAILKSGNYLSYFSDNPVTITGLTPLGYTTKLWGDDSVARLSRVLKYTKRECTPVPVHKVELSFRDVYKKAVVKIKTIGSGNFEQQSYDDNPGTIDITDKFVGSDGQVRVGAIADAPHFYYSYRWKLRVDLKIDGNIVDSYDNVCISCGSNENLVTWTVNKFDGTWSAIKN